MAPPSGLNNLNRNINAAVDISGNTTITGNAKKGKDKINKLNNLNLKNEIKTLRNQQKTARNFDRSTGLDETEADIARLQEIATQQIADAEAAERAKQAIEEANRYGKSQFETLLEIANENGLNATEFLKAFGFNSPEELKDNPEFTNSLVNWGMAAGRFDENTYVRGKYDADGNFHESNDSDSYYVFLGEEEYDKDGKYVGNPKLERSVDALSSMISMFGYVEGYDMVSVDTCPYFIGNDGSVLTSDGLIEEMLTDIVTSSSECDFNSIQKTYYGIYNSSTGQFVLDQTIKNDYEQPNVTTITVKDEKGNVVETKKVLTNADENFDIMFQYLLDNNYKDLFDIEYVQKLGEKALDDYVEDESWEYDQKHFDFYRNLVELYYSSNGYKIVGDKDGAFGYSLQDLDGNTISDGSAFLGDGKKNSDMLYELRQYLFDHVDNYATVASNLSGEFPLITEHSMVDYTKQVALLNDISDEALHGWRMLVNPLVNVGVGIAKPVEAFVDTGAYIGGAYMSGSMYEQAGDYQFYAGLLRLLGLEEMATSFDEAASMVNEMGDNAMDETKVFIARDLNQELKDWLDNHGWAVEGDANKIFQDIGSAIPEVLAVKLGLKSAYRFIKGFGETLDSGYNYYKDKYYKEHPEADPKLNEWTRETVDEEILLKSLVNSGIDYFAAKLQKLGDKAERYIWKFGAEFIPDAAKDFLQSVVACNYEGYTKKDANGKEVIDWNALWEDFRETMVDDGIKAFVKTSSLGSDNSNAAKRLYLSPHTYNDQGEFIDRKLNWGLDYLGNLLDKSEGAAQKPVRKKLISLVSLVVGMFLGNETEAQGGEVLSELLHEAKSHNVGETITTDDGERIQITEDGLVFFLGDGKVYKATAGDDYVDMTQLSIEESIAEYEKLGPMTENKTLTANGNSTTFS